MTLHADFASQDYFRNPAAAIEKLRASGPVVRVRFPIVGTVWATTTQALADQVLKDTETGQRASLPQRTGQRPGAPQRRPQQGRWPGHAINLENRSPKERSRLRPCSFSTPHS